MWGKILQLLQCLGDDYTAYMDYIMSDVWQKLLT